MFELAVAQLECRLLREIPFRSPVNVQIMPFISFVLSVHFIGSWRREGMSLFERVGGNI